MLDVHMFSSATKVKGQGVGSAYLELIGLLKKYFPQDIKVSINNFGKADISHYHTIDPQFYLSTFLPGRGRKIGYVHFLPETLEGSLKIPQPFKWIFYHYVISFYRRMDQLVVVNPSFIEQLAAYGIDKKKVTYIPNFVAKKNFHQIDYFKKNELRKKLGLPVDKFTIIGVGQIQERKGVLDFIKLAQLLPDFYFVWAGGFSFGKITDGYRELKKYVADPPINLKFPGIVERNVLGEFYNAADAFFLPSFNELFPMSILEAASCGLPIIVRNLKLYRSILDSKYLAGETIKDFQQLLVNLANNQQLRDQQRRLSLTIAEEYSEDRLAKKWLEFYRSQSELNNL